MREKILYFEGEPRFEMKFIRRAVADDKNLQIVTLQRTADNKFLRLDVDTPDELAGGFPKTRDELFAYRGLILGSIEAGAFSGDQLQMIADFVDRRGGGLLMLGGARSFGEGGYGGTPVADALPLVIDPKHARVATGDLCAAESRCRPGPARRTPRRRLPPAKRRRLRDGASCRRSRRSTRRCRSSRARPCCSTAPTNAAASSRRSSSQRVRPRQGIAFPAQDSWQWQMHASIPLEDMTHENFWRQMLRWLVDDVPAPVEVRTTTDRVEPGEAVTIEGRVVDPTCVDVNDAHVMAHVTAAGRRTLDVPLQWTGERDGQYRGTFVSTRAGRLRNRGRCRPRAASRSAAHRRTSAPAPGDAEYFDPTMHEAPLRRIADETGGRFYTPADVAGLAEDVSYAGRGVTSVEERELWNMPIILIMLVGLVCAEWGYRRAVGLADGRVMLHAFLLIVVGLAGDPEHGEPFHKWGAELAECGGTLGVPRRSRRLSRRSDGGR